MSRFPRLVKGADLEDPTSGIRHCANKACEGVAYDPNNVCDACIEAQELISEARKYAREMDEGIGRD